MRTWQSGLEIKLLSKSRKQKTVRTTSYLRGDRVILFSSLSLISRSISIEFRPKIAEVIRQWFSGHTRDEIAKNYRLDAGTVSNIINEWRKGLNNSENESIRELAVLSKKEAMTLSDVAALVRLNNFIQKLGANLEEIESFTKNISDSTEPENSFPLQIKSTIFSIGSFIID